MREEAWSRLETEPFDLLIIGGGITGAGDLRAAPSAGTASTAKAT